VRIRDIAQAGGLLDRAVELGSNYVTGINFTAADPKPLEDEARRAAVADARGKAELYAEAAGVTLGPVVRIEEEQDQFGGPQPMMARSMAAESAVPVEAGEITFRARVRVDWALRE
ncbi:MAG TPA: SIMPL domain-containing protein, partial [Afifellaceae bacterium]|nr:SIMPL domain-containing protein [Afifellaceae bacterium]